MISYCSEAFGASGVLGLLWMVAVWALVVGAMLWIVLSATRREQPHRVEVLRNNVMETIKERYAKGEITSEEFERLRNDLS